MASRDERHRARLCPRVQVLADRDVTPRAEHRPKQGHPGTATSGRGSDNGPIRPKQRIVKPGGAFKANYAKRGIPHLDIVTHDLDTAGSLGDRGRRPNQQHHDGPQRHESPHRCLLQDRSHGFS